MRRAMPDRIGRGRMLAAALLTAAMALAGCETTTRTVHKSDAPHAQDEAAFTSGVAEKPTPKLLYASAKLLVAQEQDAQARAVLRRIIDEYPQYRPAYTELAELHLRGGRLEGAIETLSEALRHAPQDPVLQNDLGMCWMLRGEYSAALERFEGAVAAQPDDARYQANRAAALGLLGRYEASLEAYKRVLRPAEAHHNLAVLCEARGDKARAAEEYRRAELYGNAARSD